MIDHLSYAIRAAVLAGREIESVYAKPINVELKDDRSPLTEADKNAHEMIILSLAPSGMPVLSEEGRSVGYSERHSWERFWMVDPLDGTKEFIKRNGEFTVNIALIHHGVPIVGVVYAPLLDVIYFAADGRGSFKLEADAEYLQHLVHAEHIADKFIEAGFRLPMKQEQRAFKVVASRSHMSPETEEFIESLRKHHGNVELVSKGSSLKLCLVAEGSADVYPRFAPTMEWDTAAGHAVVRCAGMKVIEKDTDKEIRYNKQELLNPWFVVAK